MGRIGSASASLCLLGMDGSGKTTIATLVGSMLTREGYPNEYVPSRHGFIAWLPTRFRERRGSFLLDLAQSGKAQKPAGWVRLIWMRFLLLLMCLDGVAGYWLFIHPKIRGRIGIFDRYFYDHLIAQLELAPGWLRWCYLHLLPRPNLVVLLDLPAEAAHLRKPEFPLDFFRKMRQRHLQFARLLGDGVFIVDNSSKLPEDTAQLICRRIVTLWEGRRR